MRQSRDANVCQNCGGELNRDHCPEPVTDTTPTSSRGDTDRWAELAARLGTDLFLDLQPDPSTPTRGRGARLRARLADALRESIADGRLAPGTSLPPYRSLAADLQIARGTVAAAYADLVAEGRLVARQGSRTRVAAGNAPPPVTVPPVAAPTVRHDFSLGQPNSSLFPRTAWIAATRRAVSSAPDSAFGPSLPNGSATLRGELAAYLSRVRGVRTTPEHIVLTTSVNSALGQLSRTVFGRSVAVESVGLPFHRDAVTAQGTHVEPIAVDADGAVIEELAHLDVCAALLTPSHQFPLGVALAPARRMAAIEWARATGSWIVEDDYDGELRYDRQPVGALQGLAPDRVIYVGSVSKSLSPALRIGWLVLPPTLVETVMWAKGIREPDASIVDQLVLADLIATGNYDKHIRRSRAFYRRRRDQLTTRLATAGVEVFGVAAGLHATIPVPVETEQEILATCYERGFALAGLDAMRHPDAPRPTDAAGTPLGGIIVGFGTPAASTFATDLDALVTLLREFTPA